MHTTTTIALALLALSSGCLGPDAECYSGDYGCDDNVAFNCAGGCIFTSCKTHWEAVPCEADQVCVEAGEQALCALSSEPDPSCTTGQQQVRTVCGCKLHYQFFGRNYQLRGLRAAHLLAMKETQG